MALCLLSPLSACSTLAPTGDEVTQISQVLSEPQSQDGRQFRGEAFVFVGERYYAFVPAGVDESGDPEQRGVIVLAGVGWESLDAMGLRTGDRLQIQGRIRVDRRCFQGNICVPWTHPVFIDNLRATRP